MLVETGNPGKAMGKLTTGGGTLPEGWGIPSPVWVRNWFGMRRMKTGGIVWNGAQPPTAEDFRAIRAFYGEDVRIDAGTLVGQNDPSYKSFYDRHKKTRKVKLW